MTADLEVAEDDDRDCLETGIPFSIRDLPLGGLKLGD
jgi:hypothetical protein